MVYGVDMMIRTQVMFPEEMLSDLRSAALVDGSSVSGVLREIVKEKLTKSHKEKKSGVEALLMFVKKTRKYKNIKAPADLSVNDDYLYKL
jgi:hypothetical protein